MLVDRSPDFLPGDVKGRFPHWCYRSATPYLAMARRQKPGYTNRRVHAPLTLHDGYRRDYRLSAAYTMAPPTAVTTGKSHRSRTGQHPVFSESSAMLSISDRWLKLMVGVIGVSFVVYKGLSHRILPKLQKHSRPGCRLSALFGATAGTTSTLAHAAAPIAQMYFLLGKLPKMQFAATLAGYFFLLNLIKLVPFIALGRLDAQTTVLSLNLLPIVPLGVAAGYLIVQHLKSKWYLTFIHLILLITASTLIFEALTHD